MGNYDTTSYRIYLIMMAVTIAILSSGLGLLGYFLWPGLRDFHYGFALGVEAILISLCILYVVFGVILWSTLEGPLICPQNWLRLINRSLYRLFPMTIFMARLVGVSKERLSQSLIELMNHLVRSARYPVAPERLLLLTPHCLQHQSCVHKVTTDVENCKQCGRCQVGALLTLAHHYGCSFIVVTGGTLARLMVKEKKPQAIIAIACERDLVSGMQDVFPIPVIGILNERPEGPCCNTRVQVDYIEKVIKELLYGNK